jgi:DNA topoisomerase IB
LKQRAGPGEQLFVYRNGDGRWVDARSEHVNDYLKARAGEDFSAKDFRTWHATVLAALTLAGEPSDLSRTARERAIRTAVERVADHLGNTAAVCRSSYIDPRVFDRFRAGEVIPIKSARSSGSNGVPRRRSAIEAEVLELLS